MSFPEIDVAHHALVGAVDLLAQPGADPIPITLVSIDERETAQLVVFDNTKWSKAVVVQRLRAAAYFLENHK